MGLFGGGEEEKERGEIPVREVEGMINRGMSSDQIINYLRREGYSTGQIRDAVSQAQVRRGATSEGPEKGPGPPREGGQPRRKEQPRGAPEGPPKEGPSGKPSIIERRKGSEREKGPGEIERIVESVVEEKWKDISLDIRDLEDWNRELESRIKSIKEKIQKITEEIDSINEEIKKGRRKRERMVESVRAEISAFEKVLEKIVPKLSTSVKDLSRAVGEVKEGKGGAEELEKTGKELSETVESLKETKKRTEEVKETEKDLSEEKDTSE